MTEFPFKMLCQLAEPSNAYLPPPSPIPSTDSPIVIHPPEDFDMSVYLPPFNEEIPPPENVEPPSNYLPPENVSNHNGNVHCLCMILIDTILDSRQSVFAAS